MASRYKQTKIVPRRREIERTATQDTYDLLGDEKRHAPTDESQSASWWADKEEYSAKEPSLGDQLVERDQHVARLQDNLRREREKGSRLQFQCNQQGAELRRREQQNNRLKERLSQLSERQREKGSTIELLNSLSKRPRGKDQTGRTTRPTGRQEEAALRLMLERREAELREAMKLRHCLTTLLHALRAAMERALTSLHDDDDDDEDDDGGEEIPNKSRKLAQSELELGDHVTGGVVQGWVKVQRKLGELLARDHPAAGTDQDKFVSQLETELEQSQQLVKLQQQLLQDSVFHALPSALVDSYFLEEWEELQARCAELESQRRSFQRERRAFTDAAIRLGHQRRDFEQQRASLVKQQYLSTSPAFGRWDRRTIQAEATIDLSASGHVILSGCRPSTPLKRSQHCHDRVRVQTPSTPELYSALRLQYSDRSSEGEPQIEIWDSEEESITYTS